LCYASLLGLLGPATQADAQKGKRYFSNSNAKDDNPHRGRNFQTDSIIGAIGDDILWDARTGWMHKVACEIILTWRRKEQRCLAYGIDLDDSRVPSRHQVGYKKALTKPQRYGLMMDVNQGVQLVESEWCAALLKKVKHGFETNKGGFQPLALLKH
jgi:hypothetical protein